MVVQPRKDGDVYNDPGPLHRPTEGRILAQRQVRAHLIVVGRIRRKNLPQVRLTKDQHPVQALAPHRAIRRSTYGFCQGDRGEIGRSRMLIALTRDMKTCP
jgi:hypothetical protein